MIWVLLLRGINVGGKNKLPMAELRTTLASLGAQEIDTYIQSGNAVFSGDIDPAHVAPALETVIEASHGFRPDALLLPATELQDALADFPYPQALDDPKTGHIWFLKVPPKTPDLGRLTTLAAPDEAFTLQGSRFYLHAPSGIGRSKLAARVETALGQPATARNLNTIIALTQMITARDG